MLDSIYRIFEGIGYPGPIHPWFNRVPTGMALGALVLGLGGWLLRRPEMSRAARYCIILALILLVPSALTGYLDWQHYYAGVWLVSIIIKVILTGALLVLLIFSIILSRRPESKGAVVIYLLCFLTILVQGYFGENLVLGGGSILKEFQAGAAIYNANCRSCHPNGQNVINPRRPVLGSPHLRNFSDFVNFNRGHLVEGQKGMMPPIPESKISERQMQDLYLYITNFLEKPGEKLR